MTLLSAPTAVLHGVAHALPGFVPRDVKGVAGVAREAAQAFTPRRRKVWSNGHRIHVELRQLEPDELTVFAATTQLLVEQLDGVEWVEVNPFTNRVVVSVREQLTTAADVVAVVESAEAELGLIDRRFDPFDEHPADRQGSALATLELAIDGGALLVSLLRRLSRGEHRLATADAAQLVLALQYLPALRARLEGGGRRPLVEFGTAALTSAVHAATGRPAGPVVGLVEHGIRLHGANARYGAWSEREPDLCAKPHTDPFVRVPLPPRPPVPDGPLEAAERWIPPAALTAAAASVPLLRSRERAVGLLSAAAPRAVRVGRNVFRDAFHHTLAHRGVIALDDTALELLDRVDVALVEAGVLVDEVAVVSDVQPCGAKSPGELWTAAASLLDPYDLDGLHTSRRWMLGPLDELDGVHGADGADVRLRVRRAAERPGSRTLGLVRRGGRGTPDHLAALVVVRPTLRPGAAALLDAIRDADLRLGVMTAEPIVAELLGAADVHVPGSDLVGAVRDLQAEGHVVWCTATGPLDVLDAADVALGMPHPLEPTPWSADLIGNSLRDAELIAHACRRARGVSRRSARVAVAGSATAAGAAALTRLPGAAARAASIVEASALVAAADAVRAVWVLDHLPERPEPLATLWHALAVDEVLARVGSTRGGLTAAEASRRRKPPRAAPGAPAVLLRTIAEEAWNPLTPVLAAGAALSWLIGSPADAATVAAVIGLDAGAGGLQRFQATRAVRALADGDTQVLRARRDGTETSVDATELVVGDVVVLGAGDRVPADCRVIEADGVDVDEASLTGESALVAKSPAPTWASSLGDRTSMLYADSVVAVGRAVAVVVAIDDDTESGRAAVLAAAQPRRASGLESSLEELTRTTLPVAAGAGLGVGVLGLLRGQPLRDVLSTGVSLAVAAVPEGLPLLATTAELAAARRLSARQILVHQPSTVEALGRADVLLLDKTGTLTEGSLHVAAVFDGNEVRPIEALDGPGIDVLAAAAAATPLDRPEQARHPTDRAVASVAAALGVPASAPLRALRFDPERGYHATLLDAPGGATINVKGAPEHVFQRCRWGQGPARRRRYEAAVETLAGEGYRVLAVARRSAGDGGSLGDDDVRELEPLGLLALGDPVRPTAAGAVGTCREAGLRVCMLTGDHPATACHVARLTGLLPSEGDLSELVLTGADIDVMDDEALSLAIEQAVVIARATPTHKVRVVRAFQQRGSTVAMVGDGANDTAPIRMSDVGIAVGASATRAARSTADLLVLDDGLDAIVDAIVEGRAMWSAVQDAVSLLLGHNLGEIAFTAIGSAVAGTPPLSARQLLLVNLLTDVIPTMTVVTRASSPERRADLLAAGPRTNFDAGLRGDLLTRAAATAAGATLGWGVARATGTPTRARTVGLVALVGTHLAQTMLVAGNRPSVWLATGATATVMTGIVQTPLVSQLFGCRPLGPLGWATALGAAASATAGQALLGNRLTGALAPAAEPLGRSTEPSVTDNEGESVMPTALMIAAGAATLALVRPVRERVVATAYTAGRVGADLATTAFSGVAELTRSIATGTTEQAPPVA